METRDLVENPITNKMIKLEDVRGEGKIEFGEYDLFTSMVVQYIVDKGQKFEYAKKGDAGLDIPVIMDGLRGTLDLNEGPVEIETEGLTSYVVYPKQYIFFPAGLRVKVPYNSWGYVKTRSSTAPKRGLHVIESVIDGGYTGPLYSVVFNPNEIPIEVKEGDVLAQLVLVPLHLPNSIWVVDEMPQTERGANGFGSTTPGQFKNS